MDKAYAQYLLEKTRKDYDLIAEEFSKTREYAPEDRMALLFKYIKSGDRVLDLGCGNGRFYEALRDKKINYLGADYSKKMIEIAKRRYPEADFRVIDALDLSFPENYFDVIFSFAVVHHIPSEELRLKFLTEAKKVLKPGGCLILTVWNLNPIKMLSIGERGRVGSFLRHQLLKLIGISRLDFGDFYISWKNIVPRYIHCFTARGFKKLALESGFKVKNVGILVSSKTKESNIYIVVEK